MITSVADWLPELPPLATTSGMKATSQSWDSAGSQLESTIAVTAAVANKIASHTPRFQVIEVMAASR